MRDIVEKVVNFFSSKLGVVTDEQKKELVDSFMNTQIPELKSVKKTVTKRASSSASSECTNKCCYVIKKKDGTMEVCGKNAKNELDGKFYCGPADKAGHYQSTVKLVVKKNPAPFTRSATAPAKSSTVGQPTLGGTSNGAQSLLLKLQQNRTPGSNVAYKVPGTDYFIIREKRILMNIKLNEAYGILGEDNKTVKPLDSEAVAYLKERNISYTTLATTLSNEEDAAIEDIEDDDLDEDEEDESEEDEE